MFAINSDLLLFLICFHVSHCYRRIQDGEVVTHSKPYVVYLVKAPVSSVQYDYWLCGGAIVSKNFVVTSAACIKDVDYLYVIAGYDKYVTDAQIDTDPCTSQKKKKVIFTCFPEGYQLQYDRIDKWALIDIGVVKVESPYDFADESYKTVCSYIPAPIPIGYDARYQEPGTDALVYGWGHLESWRAEKNKNNFNQLQLHFAPVSIIEKESCKKAYEDYGRMPEIIDKYMICSNDSGHIDDSGQIRNEDTIKVYNCNQKRRGQYGPYDEKCEEDDQVDDPDFTRRKRNKSNRSKKSRNKRRNKNIVHKRKSSIDKITAAGRTVNNGTTIGSEKGTSSSKLDVLNRNKKIKRVFNTNKTRSLQTNMKFGNSRRFGICQNDHGGPLVAWVGTHEILIGVASVFKLSEFRNCIGPFLYTSTQCSGAFLHCILTHDSWPQTKQNDGKTRRSLCKSSTSDPGHVTYERHISWVHHPSGAADNEKNKNNKRNGPKAKKKQRIANPKSIRAPVQNMYQNNGQMFRSNQQQQPNQQFNNMYVTMNYLVNGNYAQNNQFAANGKNPVNGNYPSYNVQFATSARNPFHGNFFTLNNNPYKLISNNNQRILIRPVKMPNYF